MDNLLFSYAEPGDPPLRRGLIRMIERATGQPRLKRLYLDHRRETPEEDFFRGAVRRLGLDIRVLRGRLDAIPSEGPVVVVANHPFGVLDGIAISWLVGQIRPDFRVLTHAALLRAPEARPFLLPVDFAGTAQAMQTNLSTRATARDHLAAGGCVVVFPAGAVSTAPDRLGRRPAVDAPWQPFTAQLIQRSRATVVPVYFAGQNSRLFQIASHMNQTLRLSLIFKEVRDRMNTMLPVAVGEALRAEELAGLGDRQALVDALRQRTYALGEGLDAPRPRPTRPLAAAIGSFRQRRARAMARGAATTE